jgi:hypothetical protein
MKLFFTFSLLFLYTINNAQQRDSTSFSAVSTDTSVHFKAGIYREKRAPLWRPVCEVLTAQLIPFTFNNFSTKPNISKISFHSIRENLNFKNWEFDDDKFLTNQFAHPYHGNLYFNAFRSNGYSFWQSVPGTIAGSLVWEVAGETNHASYNDMVNTSLGGIALGEMTYRMAGLIINRKRHGRTRITQELLATLINPMNGFNRLVDKKWQEVSPTDPEDSLAVDLTVDAGTRIVNKHPNQLFKNSRTEFFGSAKLNYGNPFKDYKLPFDNFRVLIEVGNADSSKLNSLWVQGSLWGKIVGGGDKSLKMLRLTMNYDFYKNTAFEYGGQSLLLTWLAHFHPGSDWIINTELGGGAVILAASLDKHRVYKEARNYTYGSGFAIYTTGEIVYRNKLTYLFNFRSSWTGTINGSSSSKALHLVTSELKYRVFKNFTVSGSWGNYELVGFYPGYTSTDDVYPFLRFSAGYKLTL